MSEIWETPFIVVDVETSGPDPKKNRIIDIACAVSMGGEIIREFSSLVGSKQYIPPFITQMTGISREMTLKAPPAKEVLKEFLRLFEEFENPVFVAHNAQFDYNFIAQSLKRAKLPPLEAPALCSLKLARKLLPSEFKKGLDALAEYFQVKPKNRHRALGDAIATAQILPELLRKAEIERGIDSVKKLLKFQNKKIQRYRASADAKKRLEKALEKLPDSPGIYYFLGSQKEILRVGKAKSLKSKARAYFFESSFASQRIRDLLEKTRDIAWETTRSELSAALLEAREIKKHAPPYNYADSKDEKFYFIKFKKESPNDNASLIVVEEMKNDEAKYFGPFKNRRVAEYVLKRTLETLRLAKRREKEIGKRNGGQSASVYDEILKCRPPCVFDLSLEYAREINRLASSAENADFGAIANARKQISRLAEKSEPRKAKALRKAAKELSRISEPSKNPKIPLNSLNLIIGQLSENKEILEVFAVKNGKLKLVRTISKSEGANRDLIDELTALYESEEESDYAAEEIAELKVLLDWLDKQNGSAKKFAPNGAASIADNLSNLAREIFNG